VARLWGWEWVCEWSDVAVGRVLELSGQSLFVFQEETLVTREEVDGVQLARSVCADGLHEAERLADALDDCAVFRVEFLVADMTKVPVQRVVQVCDAGRNLCTQVVVSGRRVEVGLHQAIWVQISLVRRETVQDIAPEAGNLLAIDSLHGRASGLCILARHPRNAHDRLVPAPNKDERHLKQQLDLGVDGILVAVIEQLGAVAALEEEGFALCYVGERAAKAPDLSRSDYGRQAVELCACFLDGLLVFVFDGLLDGAVPPGRGRPFGRCISFCAVHTC